VAVVGSRKQYQLLVYLTSLLRDAIDMAHNKRTLPTFFLLLSDVGTHALTATVSVVVGGGWWWWVVVVVVVVVGGGGGGGGVVVGGRGRGPLVVVVVARFFSQGDAVVEINPDAMATQFATLFIDHPAPTGLSVFCQGNGAEPAGTQEANAVQFISAVKTVLERHPQFVGRDIFLAGESYAGRFLPAIASEAKLSDPAGVGASLKGLMIGNGEVDAAAAFASYGPFMYATGFLSEPQRDELADVSSRCSAAVAAEDWAAATDVCYTIRQKVTQWTVSTQERNCSVRAIGTRLWPNHAFAALLCAPAC
jgi:carboxypeptidase C (cathepsin A)